MWIARNVLNGLMVWAEEIFERNVESASWIILAAYDKDRER